MAWSPVYVLLVCRDHQDRECEAERVWVKYADESQWELSEGNGYDDVLCAFCGEVSDPDAQVYVETWATARPDTYFDHSDQMRVSTCHCVSAAPS